MSAAGSALRGKTVVVGVGGGIAAYKAVELIRLLSKAGAEIRVAMTTSAREFVTPLTFQTLSGQQVMTNMFDPTQESEIGHIRIADGADLLIVAPATANLIARMAAGMANCPVSAAVLATRAPVLVAPSMNVNMWDNPITQRNLEMLRDLRGFAVVGPGAGFLACRWTGPGRLAEPADIVEAANHVLTEQDLAGKHLLVTAGPTHEALDPVRFLGNRSTGKMGYAVARAAAWRGAEVTLVSGPTALDTPLGVERIDVESATEMAEATLRAARRADAVVMAAAVADFRPATYATQKLKKGDAISSAPIQLTANQDILAELGRRRGTGKRPLLVGFAAETEQVVDYARTKLRDKGCDLIVANDVSRADAGFASSTNEVSVVSHSGIDALPLMSKDEVAHALLDRLVKLFGGE